MQWNVTKLKESRSLFVVTSQAGARYESQLNMQGNDRTLRGLEVVGSIHQNYLISVE